MVSNRVARRTLSRTRARAGMVREVERLGAAVEELLAAHEGDAEQPATEIVVYRAFDRASRTRGALLQHRLATAGFACTTITPTATPGISATGLEGAERSGRQPAAFVDATGTNRDALRMASLHDVPLIRLAAGDRGRSGGTRQPPQTVTTLIWLLHGQQHGQPERWPRGAALTQLAIAPRPGASARLDASLLNSGTELIVPCPPHAGLHLQAHAHEIAITTPPEASSSTTRIETAAVVTAADAHAEICADTMVVATLTPGSRLHVEARVVNVWHV